MGVEDLVRKQQRKKKQQADWQKNIEKKKLLIKEVCSNKAGIEFFRILARNSSFFDTTLSFNTVDGHLDVQETIMKESRRSQYLQFRSLMDKDTILKIEIEEN
jgi:hypothetical protein